MFNVFETSNCCPPPNTFNGVVITLLVLTGCTMTQKRTKSPQPAQIAVVTNTATQPTIPVIGDGLTIKPTPIIISTPILIETKTNTIASAVVYSSSNKNLSIITNRPIVVPSTTTVNVPINKTNYSTHIWIYILAFLTLVTGIFIGVMLDRYQIPLVSPFKSKDVTPTVTPTETPTVTPTVTPSVTPTNTPTA